MRGENLIFNMPRRCGWCRHWQVADVVGSNRHAERQTEGEGFGICSLHSDLEEESRATPIATGARAFLMTSRTFGCVEWKEKGCEHHYAEITTHDDKDDVFACIVEGCGHKIRRDRIALTGGPT
jgi:hypothetical protein